MILTFKKIKTGLLPGFIIAIIISLSASFIYFDIYYYNIAKNTDQTAVIDGVVIKNGAYTTYSSNYDVVITRINNKKTNVKAKLQTEFPCDFNENETFTIKVTFTEMEDVKLNFREKIYNLSKGILLKAVSDKEEKESVKITGTAAYNIKTFFKDCNEFCSEIFKKNLNKESYRFIDAILLGNRDNLSDTIKRDLRYIGLSHIIAISGMHFAVLLSSLQFILQFFRIPKSVICAVLISFSLFFMSLTGFSPSVTRSAVMCVLYHLSFFFGRTNDSPTSLFLSVTLICLVSPNAVLDVGLLLSFTATLGIVTLGSYIQNYFNKKIKSKNIFIALSKNILNSLSMVICVILFTLPLMWLYFGTLSVISPVTNLLCNIPVTLILYTAPLLIIFNKVPLLAYIIKIIVEFTYSAFINITGIFVKFDNLTISLNYSFVKYIFIILFTGLIVITFLKIKNPLIYFIPAGVSIIAFVIFLNIYNATESEIVRCIYYTYKSNDGFVLKYKNKAVICDISDGSAAISNIGYYLLSEKLNILNIDTYMFTHYHQRHISTIYNLSEKTYIKNIIMPTPTNATDENVINTVNKLAAENGWNVYFYDKADEAEILLFQKIYINVMQYSKLSRSTHPLLAFYFNIEENKLFYIGRSALDLNDKDYFDKNIENSSVLILGQHGPKMKNNIIIGNFNENLSYLIFANPDITNNTEAEDAKAIRITHNAENYYSEMIFYVH